MAAHARPSGSTSTATPAASARTGLSHRLAASTTRSARSANWGRTSARPISSTASPIVSGRCQRSFRSIRWSRVRSAAAGSGSGTTRSRPAATSPDGHQPVDPGRVRRQEAARAEQGNGSARAVRRREPDRGSAGVLGRIGGNDDGRAGLRRHGGEEDGGEQDGTHRTDSPVWDGSRCLRILFRAHRRCQCMAPRRLSDSRADAERSFEQLYRGHRNDVYRVALRALGNSEDAEDVTQAAFVDAYRAVLRGTRPQEPRAWLLTIAENVRRRRFRTSLRRPREEPLDADAALAAEESHAQARSLLEALATLPTEQREAFLLREINGLSYDEIAQQMGSTVASVQMLLFRARRTLRNELDPPHVYGALFPLTTLFSRFESFSLTPRAAGAVGAAVVAVSVSAERAGQRRPRAREPGSDACRRGRSGCRTRTGRRRPSPPRGRNRRRHGRPLLRSDAPRRRLRSRSPSSLRPGRAACRCPDSSAASRRPRNPSRSPSRRARVRHRRRCPWHCRRCLWRCRRCLWRCRRCPCPRSRFRSPRCSRRSSSHCSRM